jgi:hypothetical protein
VAVAAAAVVVVGKQLKSSREELGEEMAWS